MVLKSHKRAIAWKLSDIKGIDPEFCTHKILMEDDFEPAYNLFVYFWCTSTRSSARNLFPPLDNLELTTRRRSRADLTLLHDFEMAAKGNGDPPVPDIRTMMELCQPSWMVGPPLAKLRTYMLREPIKVIPTNLKWNNQGRNQFFQGASHGQNPLPAYQAPAYQAPRSDNYLGPPGFIQNQNRNNQNQNLQNKNTNQENNHHPQWNNQGRNQFFQGAIMVKTHFQANDAILKNMQTNMTSLTNSNFELKNMFVWNKISLPELSLMCMTLELADHSISCPVGVAEDVFVKVGTFHFPVDFVVIDFDADPRVPLILRRSFLKIKRALIDVFKGELTLRVGKEAITFNLDQTLGYSADYNDMMANRIDVIDMACEEYSQEVLSFFDVIVSGNPTPYYDPIVSTSSPTLTPFGDSDFLLEEVDAFLALEDDLTLPEFDQSYVDTKGDILLLEAFLNADPSLPPPNQGNYLPQFRNELKICEAKTDKSSIDEPPEVALKDLPPHLEYAFL
nr:reverse transcriptase domain-containing protein [Tanacetum cinerariifolium]